MTDSIKKVLTIIDKYWTFDSFQCHSHTWHDKQDCIQELQKLDDEIAKENINPAMLTLEKFNSIMAGAVFAKGLTVNSPEGIYAVSGSQYEGKSLRWVAVKGFGNDWAIYYGWAIDSYERIEVAGTKTTIEENILRLVPCDAEVLERYNY